MADWIATGVLAAYYATLVPLALYGVHRLRLLSLLARPAAAGVESRRAAEDLPRPRSGQDCPKVTVQLPIYNELLVAPRLVEAVAALDYPRDRLEIQVLDDSDDETSELLATQVASLRSAGVDIRHLTREVRDGFKAGALKAGLSQAEGDLIAIFDADFVPQPDFLRRTIGYFDDSEIGMVQAAWGHLNRRFSWLTAIQALLLDGHFQVEHAARARGGLFFNFNGTAGVWRRQTIEDAGGWQHDTLTEDLDLSYRAQLRGWRFVFCPNLLVPSELPIEIGAFKSQQHRWTHGAAQTLRKLLPRILRAPIPFRVKLEAVAHLSAHLCYPLMVVFTALLFPSMVLRAQIGPSRWLWYDMAFFAAATVSIVLFFLRSQRNRKGAENWRRTLVLQLPLMALGIGMSLHNARAALTGLVRRGGTFVRTPKNVVSETMASNSRLETDDRSSTSPVRYAAATAGRTGELVMLVYLMTAIAVAIGVEMWFSLPFLLLFASGYGYVLYLSWTHSRRLGRATSSSPPRSVPQQDGMRSADTTITAASRMAS